MAARPAWTTSSACAAAPLAVHDRGCLIAARPDDTFTFYAPDGTEIPASPALPPPDDGIEDIHDADITPQTIIPPWHGERLDLDYAIYTCLANEQLRRDRAAGHDDAEGPAATGYQPGDWYQFVRQSDTGQAAYAPTYLPVQV